MKKFWPLLFFVSLASTAMGIAGCNTVADYALVGGAFVPSAHGEIRVQKLDKGQKLIEITMDHLPAPGEIEAGLNYYVVWFVEVGGVPVPKGTLDYDPETRVGVAAIPTDMLQFDMQITAEQSETPVQPSDLVVASQRISEKK